MRSILQKQEYFQLNSKFDFSTFIDYDVLKIMFEFMLWNERCKCRYVCVLWRYVIDYLQLVESHLCVAVLGSKKIGKSSLISKIMKYYLKDKFPIDIVNHRYQQFKKSLTSCCNSSSNHSFVPLRFISDKTKNELKNGTQNIKYHHTLIGREPHGVLTFMDIQAGNRKQSFLSCGQSDVAIIIIPNDIYMFGISSRVSWLNEWLLTAIGSHIHRILICIVEPNIQQHVPSSQYNTRQYEAPFLDTDHFHEMKTFVIEIIEKLKYHHKIDLYVDFICLNELTNDQFWSSDESEKFIQKWENILLPIPSKKEFSIFNEDQIELSFPYQNQTDSYLIIDYVFDKLDYDNAIVCGRIHYGSFHRGQEIWIQPNGVKTQIINIQRFGNTLEWAKSGDIVGIQLKSISPQKISSGFVLKGINVLVHPNIDRHQHDSLTWMKPVKSLTVFIYAIDKITIGLNGSFFCQGIKSSFTVQKIWRGKKFFGINSCDDKYQMIECPHIPNRHIGLVDLVLHRPTPIMIPSDSSPRIHYRIILRGSRSNHAAFGYITKIKSSRNDHISENSNSSDMNNIKNNDWSYDNNFNNEDGNTENKKNIQFDNLESFENDENYLKELKLSPINEEIWEQFESEPILDFWFVMNHFWMRKQQW